MLNCAYTLGVAHVDWITGTGALLAAVAITALRRHEQSGAVQPHARPGVVEKACSPRRESAQLARSETPTSALAAGLVGTNLDFAELVVPERTRVLLSLNSIVLSVL